ncbi:SDR family oxidoreductase [Paraferrimonas haliotis]|uniref:Short-chain dehydrogenase n=1 Tax=Paraferrimonas haliotis TaxID=2013866 RepID=A0AA37TU21_9GAMM|nr:SDR family oxidoreductase [Paraferrimonas haliotis]GLS84477.1 short-chain dehydrogenase [Paraferrimonas haliotis]
MNNTTKTILITGASSGLGEEMARQFAQKGYQLALCARRVERLQALKQELEQAYPSVKVSIKALDVNEDDQVSEVFEAFADEFGTLNKIIVNAGMGKGARLGTGKYYANKQTAMTNFVAALCQCEAALAIFRRQQHGQLVCVSSVSAVRGFGGTMSVYAATKAGFSALAEGIRMDLAKTPIRVTLLHPGYIDSEISEMSNRRPFSVSTQQGVKHMVAAIEANKKRAFVPAWPWLPVAWILRWLPASLIAKMT